MPWEVPGVWSVMTGKQLEVAVSAADPDLAETNLRVRLRALMLPCFMRPAKASSSDVLSVWKESRAARSEVAS